MGLYDAILIKENHIALAGGLAKAVHAARKRPSRAAGRGRGAATSTRSPTRSAPAPTVLLLDNMDPETLREAVELRDENAGRGDGPVAGGLRRRRLWRPSRAIAETGVDFISVGALTHSAPTLDFSLLLELA